MRAHQELRLTSREIVLYYGVDSCAGTYRVRKRYSIWREERMLHPLVKTVFFITLACVSLYAEERLGEVTLVQGPVQIQKSGHGGWRRALQGTALFENGKVRTGKRGYGALILTARGKQAVSFGEESVITFTKATNPQIDYELTLAAGMVICRHGSNANHIVRVTTEHIYAIGRNAHFGITYDPLDDEGRVTVFRGTVYLGRLTDTNEEMKTHLTLHANETMVFSETVFPREASPYQGKPWDVRKRPKRKKMFIIDRKRRW